MGPKKKESPCPGLELVNPANLGTQFQRFKNDDLYFITEIMYHSDKPDEKPVQKCVALTPTAFFICDYRGKMERATRLESLNGAVTQVQKVKKMIGTEESFHVVVKIPSEFDAHFSFQKDKSTGFEQATKFCAIIEKLVSWRRKKPFALEELTEGESLNVQKTRAEGYMSPEEILAHNDERLRQIQQTEQYTAEVVRLQAEIHSAQKTYVERTALLESTEASVGVDLTDMRNGKMKLLEQKAAALKTKTGLDVELLKLQGDCSRLRDQLLDERNRYELLVNERIEAEGKKEDKMQLETATLRKEAQQRELAKSANKLDELRAKAKPLPKIESAATVVNRAQDLEVKLRAAWDELERNIEAFNKKVKFLEMLNTQLTTKSKPVFELYDEKALAVEAHDAELEKIEEERKAAADAEAAKRAEEEAAKHPPSAGGDLDLDLLGGGPTPPSTAAAAAQPVDPLDLLGDGPPPTQPPPPVSGGGLDDLLGDAPPPQQAAAPPQQAAAPDMDDLLGGGPPPSAPQPPAADDPLAGML